MMGPALDAAGQCTRDIEARDMAALRHSVMRRRTDELIPYSSWMSAIHSPPSIYFFSLDFLVSIYIVYILLVILTGLFAHFPNHL